MVYSNNISPDGKNGVKPQVSTSSTTSDGTLQFREDSSTPGHGKFDQGHMIFNHALTKITVNLTAGTGFSSGFTDITTGSIVGTVKNAPYSGTLDLATGKWNDGPSTNDVKMATENDKISHTALILPGMSITSGSTIDIIDFDINGNVYHITSDMIWKGIIEGDRNEALGVENNGTSGNFLQGKHPPCIFNGHEAVPAGSIVACGKFKFNAEKKIFYILFDRLGVYSCIKFRSCSPGNAPRSCRGGGFDV